MAGGEVSSILTYLVNSGGASIILGGGLKWMRKTFRGGQNYFLKIVKFGLIVAYLKLFRGKLGAWGHLKGGLP